MSFYLDTSVVVCGLTRELKAPEVNAWLQARAADDVLVVSGWVVAEVSSALSIQLRTGRLTAVQRADALAQFRQMMLDSIAVLPISESHFHAAASFADRHDLGVRAGDAVHLAIGSAHGATVVTLDQLMAEAGLALGVRTILI